MGLALIRHMERRRVARLHPDAEVSAMTVALRTGGHASVVDMSADGAQVETSARLQPGMSLAVRAFTTWAGVVDRATVIHCSVCSLDARSGIRFRAGLRFEAGNDYPIGRPARTSGNTIPIPPRYQPGRWAARGTSMGEQAAGTKVG